jgi:hypothetical protein
LRARGFSTGKGWHLEALLGVSPSSIKTERNCFLAAWATATSGFCFQIVAPSLDFVVGIGGP